MTQQVTMTRIAGIERGVPGLWPPAQSGCLVSPPGRNIRPARLRGCGCQAGDSSRDHRDCVWLRQQWPILVHSSICVCQVCPKDTIPSFPTPTAAWGARCVHVWLSRAEAGVLRGSPFLSGRGRGRFLCGVCNHSASWLWPLYPLFCSLEMAAPHFEALISPSPLLATRHPLPPLSLYLLVAAASGWF